MEVQKTRPRFETLQKHLNENDIFEHYCLFQYLIHVSLFIVKSTSQNSHPIYFTIAINSFYFAYKFIVFERNRLNFCYFWAFSKLKISNHCHNKFANPAHLFPSYFKISFLHGGKLRENNTPTSQYFHNSNMFLRFFGTYLDSFWLIEFALEITNWFVSLWSCFVNFNGVRNYTTELYFTLFWGEGCNFSDFLNRFVINSETKSYYQIFFRIQQNIILSLQLLFSAVSLICFPLIYTYSIYKMDSICTR